MSTEARREIAGAASWPRRQASAAACGVRGRRLPVHGGGRPCAQALDEGRRRRRALTGDVEVFGTGCLGLCHAGPLVQVESDGRRRALYEQRRRGEGRRASPRERRGRRHARRRTSLDGANAAFFAQAAQDRPRELRPHRSRADRVVHRRRRLPGAAEGRHRDDAARRDRSRSQRSGLRGRGGAGYPTGLKWSTVAKAKGTREVRHLQRRRGRPRRVHGPQRAGERSAPRARRHGHRRLRRRRRPGLHLRPRRVSAGHQPAARRPSSQAERLGAARQPHLRHRLQLPRRHPHRRRRLRLRRGDGADRLDRGQAAARRGLAHPTRPTAACGATRR